MKTKDAIVPTIFALVEKESVLHFTLEISCMYSGTLIVFKSAL